MTLVGEHGQGGITARRDGRLQVSLTMLNGRRVYRMVPARHPRPKARAKELLAELQAAREADLDPTSLTLAAFLRSWIESLHRSGRVRPRTLEFYTMIVKHHIVPVLGSWRLHRLSERHVQAWLDEDDTASIHHHRNVLRIALNVAVRQRLVSRNVAVAVDFRPRSEFTGNPLSPAEAKALLALDDRLTPLWRLAIVTGLRSAELLALGWDDLADDTLTVSAQLAQTDKGWVRVPTKVRRRREERYCEIAAQRCSQEVLGLVG